MSAQTHESTRLLRFLKNTEKRRLSKFRALLRNKRGAFKSYGDTHYFKFHVQETPPTPSTFARSRIVNHSTESFRLFRPLLPHPLPHPRCPALSFLWEFHSTSFWALHSLTPNWVAHFLLVWNSWSELVPARVACGSCNVLTCLASSFSGSTTKSGRTDLRSSGNNYITRCERGWERHQ